MNPFAIGMSGWGPATTAASEDPESFQLLQQEQNRRLLANMLLARGGDHAQ